MNGQGWLFFAFMLSIFGGVLTATVNETCDCDGTSAIISSPKCIVQVVDGDPKNVAGCDCFIESNIIIATNASDGDGYVISCVDPTSSTSIITTTTKLTTPAPTTTTTEIPFIGACGVVKLTGMKSTMLKILLYLGSIWVILWTLATIIVNIVCKSSGQHRVLYILQEISIIFLFIFLGFFTTNPMDNETICKATTILLHFFLIFILGLCVTEAIFAKSLICGKSTKNGSIHLIISIGLPLILSLITALTSYFMAKKYYGLGMHCFITVVSDQFWAFVIPTWILLILSVFIGQLGFLACKKSLSDVDTEQLYWAFKTCKSLPMFSLFLISCYYLAAFGLDFQKTWLLILFLIISLLFGPLIFVTHTFNFEPTATKLWNKTHFPFYRPCEVEDIPTPRASTPDPEEKIEDEKPEDKPGGNPAAANAPKDPSKPPEAVLPGTVPPSMHQPIVGSQLPPQQPQRPSRPKKYSNDPTNSQSFYEWLTDRNSSNINASEDVLFKPKPF